MELDTFFFVFACKASIESRWECVQELAHAGYTCLQLKDRMKLVPQSLYMC